MSSECFVSSECFPHGIPARTTRMTTCSLTQNRAAAFRFQGDETPMVGMGLPFAQRRIEEAGEALVTRAMAALAVLVAALAACNSDDEAEPETTPPPTTAAETTEATDPPTTPESTAAPTTTDPPTTTQAPTTTVDVEALKAQIAADYERSWELFDELATNPTWTAWTNGSRSSPRRAPRTTHRRRRSSRAWSRPETRRRR